jgi:mannose-6-phosphate isomerase-like protein (cupin superfamily)
MSILKSALRAVCVAALISFSVGANAAQHAVSSGVTYFGHQQVAAAFAKGRELTHGRSGRAIFELLTARRDHPGEVEFHMLDTDIIYVIRGGATFVTGGTIVEPRHTAPHEIRGRSIQGGTPYQLRPGDIIIVPHGVPHWFKEVHGPFLYLVLKVR